MAEARARVVVIGAGIIGLCCAYHLFRAGFRVTIVDRALDDDRASNGNAGAIAVAEILQAPVSMSRNGKGAVPSNHYLGIPESVGHRLYAKADVVLAVGTRMYEQYFGWGVNKGM